MPKVKTSPPVLSVAEIIEELGGGVKIAAELALVPSAVSNWKKLGKIPPGRARDLVDLAGRLGKPSITLTVILDAGAGDVVGAIS